MLLISQKCLIVVALLISSLASAENTVLEWLELLAAETQRPQSLSHFLVPEVAREIATLPAESIEAAIQERTRQNLALAQEIASRPAPSFVYEPISAISGETSSMVMLRLVLLPYRQEARLTEWRSEIDSLRRLEGQLSRAISHLSGAAHTSLGIHLESIWLWAAGEGEYTSVGGPLYKFWEEAEFALLPAMETAERATADRRRSLERAESRLAEDYRTLTGNLRDWAIPGFVGLIRQNQEQRASARTDTGPVNEAALSRGRPTGTQSAPSRASSTSTGHVATGTNGTTSTAREDQAQPALGNAWDQNKPWDSPFNETQGGSANETQGGSANETQGESAKGTQGRPANETQRGKSSTAETGKKSTERDSRGGATGQGSNNKSDNSEAGAEQPPIEVCADGRCTTYPELPWEDNSSADEERDSASEDDKEDNQRRNGGAEPLTIAQDPETGEIPTVPCLLDNSCSNPVSWWVQDDLHSFSAFWNAGLFLGLPDFWGATW